MVSRKPFNVYVFLVCMVSIAFLGPSGTYSEVFAKSVDNSAKLIPAESLSQVFSQVKSGVTDFGVVPIENSLDGLIGATADLLFKNRSIINIVSSGDLDIHHALGALPGFAIITKIMSKDTALNQCSDFLDEKYPSARRIASPSTSTVMHMLVRDQIYDTAVVGNPDAIRAYGLSVIAEDIGNEKHNVTRFLVIGKSSSVKGSRNVTSIGLRPNEDYPGFLLQVLKIISEQHELNLSSLHSRPSGDGKYWFFLDLEGHKDDEKVASCLKDLNDSLVNCDVFVLGSYGVL